MVMKRIFFFVVLLALIAMVLPAMGMDVDENDVRSCSPCIESCCSLNSGFIQNLGQYDPEVAYLLQYGGETTVFLTNDELVLTHTSRSGDNISRDVIRQSFVGASPELRLTANGQRTGVVHYYRGNDPSRWFSDIPVYSTIIYDDLYPGIDLAYTEIDGRLKREFRIAPGADPAQIGLVYEGPCEPYVDETGVLRLTSPVGEMIETPLICWQVIDGVMINRTAEYVIDNGSVRIEVAEYDPWYELIIDPELVYSSYLGGTQESSPNTLINDGSGGVWVAGCTNDYGFPVIGTAYQNSYGGNGDVFLSHFSSTGTLLYSTYLGGGEEESVNDLAPDGSGGIWVTGGTGSSDFPFTVNAYQNGYGGNNDAFLSHFSSTGTLLYSTYLGGGEWDSVNDLAPDGSGGIWVTGGTGSSDFPFTVNAYQNGYRGNGDVFLSHFSSTGMLLYSTYLGGSGDENLAALVVDDEDGVWVTGGTGSSDFPVTVNAHQNSYGGNGDVFLSHFSSTGLLLDSTYLGGGEAELVNDLAPDGSGGVWLTGRTQSSTFPITSNAYQGNYTRSPDPWTFGRTTDVFISRLSSSGALLYSTYMGGEMNDEGLVLKSDSAGGVWVTGTTWSYDFPVTGNAYQITKGISRIDAFVSHFSPTNMLLYSTYLGGSGDEQPMALVADSSAGIWVTGTTWSSDFPATEDAYQGIFGGSDRGDAFITYFSSMGDLLYSTYLGGGSADHLYDSTGDNSGGIWVAGRTISHDFPVTDNAYKSQNSALYAGLTFISRFSNSSVPLYPSISVDEVSPRGITNIGSSTLTITGNGFTSDATVRLQHVESPQHIIQSDEKFESASRIHATVNFNGAAEGYWDLIVENPGGQTCVKKAAIHISPPIERPQKEDPSIILCLNEEKRLQPLWIDPLSEDNRSINIPYLITPADYSGLVIMDISDDTGEGVGEITKTVTSGGQGSLTWDGKIDSVTVNPAKNPYTVRLRIGSSTDLGQTDAVSESQKVFVGRPVLFVHGIISLATDIDIENGEDFNDFRESYYARSIEYVDSKAGTVSGNIQQFSKCFGDEVIAIMRQTGAKKVDIVAHSMGGLVSRYYIEKMRGRNNVGKLIMVQTPNHGSEWPIILKNWILIGGFFLSKVKDLGHFIDPDGFSMDMQYIDVLIQFIEEEFQKEDIAKYDSAAIGQLAAYHFEKNPFLTDLNGNVLPYTSDYYMGQNLVQDKILNPSGYIVIASQNYLTPSHRFVTIPFTENTIRFSDVTNKGDYVVSYNSAKLTVAPIVGVDGCHWNPWGNPQIMNYVTTFLNTPDDELESLANMLSTMRGTSSSIQALDTEMNESNEIGFWNDWITTNVSQSEDLNLTFTIEPFTNSARLLFLWDDGTLSLSFTAPNGTVTDTVTSENLCEYSIGAVPGTWNVTIHSVSLPGDSVELTAASHQVSPVIFEVLPDIQGTKPGDILPIYVYYGSNSEPCTGATVTATVKSPDESLINLTLHDDGTFGDDRAGDGVYSNTFADTAEPGTYLITANGSWTVGNVTLYRTALNYVTLMEYPDLTFDGITIAPQDPHAGEDIDITAILSNIGSADATNVSVTVYADINSFRYVIGNETLDIPAGDSASVTTQWKARANLHTVVAVIDSCDEVTEESYSNNVANATVSVQSLQMGLESANITIREGDVGFVPIILTNCTDLQRVTGTFVFNNSVVEFVNISSTASSINYENTPGLVRFNITYDDEVAGDISVADIVMRGVDVPGEGTETKVIIDAFDGLDLHSATMIRSNQISLIENITYNQELHADFTVNITAGNTPLTIHFTDTSTGVPTTWSWDFGDGDTSTEQNPTHIYTSPGQYSVNLTVQNAHGENTVSKLSYITASAPSGTGEVSLRAGWNLFSTPFQNSEYLVSPNSIQVVYAYNPATKGYEIASLDSLTPGVAYWVASIQDCTISITGTPPASISTDLKAGWNLVGGTDTPRSFDTITTDPPGSWGLPFVYRYNPLTQNYEETTELKPGEGYWSAALQDCSITLF